MSAARRVAVLVATLLVSIALPPPASAAKATPGATGGGEVVKTGWWWAVNEPPAETGLVAPPQPPTPNVPEGALPVAALGGDPDKISAIEFALDAEPGSLVSSSTLVLRESQEPGANANQDNAKILACPVAESFWADGSAAAWKARPDFDCDLAQASGERDQDGVWTFDLSPVTALWLSEDTTSSMSVVLVEDVDAPESFQVAFDGLAAKGIDFSVVTVSPPKPATPTTGQGGATPAVGEAGAGSTGGSGSVPLSDVGGSSAGLGGVSSAPLDAPGVVAPALDLGAGATESVADAPVAAPVAETAQVSAAPMAAPPWYSGIPKAALLLFPLVLGLAYLMMLALGPDAQPATVGTRHGVSRALDRLKQVGARTVRRSGR